MRAVIVSKMAELAIRGGPKVREKPLPYRKLFGQDELDMVAKVFENSWREGVDFGYQGKFEKQYTDAFCEFQGGGFADAVCSGTAGIYLALEALALEPGSDVIVSPVTDPGSVAPVVIAGMKPVIADSEAGSFNIGPDEFRRAITPRTHAAIVTHSGGHPVDIGPLLEIAKSKGIKIIEDCSQAHGALYKGERVGRFGDLAVFSTMYTKTHATGGCGGLVYTRNEEYYRLVRSLADRGKPFHDPGFDPKNPCANLFPALNFNLDELSCAIGLSTLSRLQETIDKRLEIGHRLDTALSAQSSVVHPCPRPPATRPSLFFHTMMVSTGKLKVTKKDFAQAVAAEGIWVNPDYKYVVSEWKWLQGYVAKEANTLNARAFRDTTFNILFNERFTEEDIQDVVRAILKVESHFALAGR